MKNIALLLLGFVIAACATPLALMAIPAEAADAGACYNIDVPDARAICLARAKHDPSYCYNVQRAELRAACLADVSR